MPGEHNILKSSVKTEESWPSSVQEAVELLITRLREKEKKLIKELSDSSKLVALGHFGLGADIRNVFGLWRGNEDLLKSCGCEWRDADQASTVILEALWEALQNR